MLRPPFYVVSDTHWFHANIVKFCNRDMNHNNIMVQRWNEVVGPDDVILHLGDVFLWRGDGAARYMSEVMPVLNGKKYLIRGNHDKPLKWDDYGYEEIEPFTMDYKGLKVSFAHYPVTHKLEPGHVHIHGHIHNNGYPRTSDWRDGSYPSRPQQENMSVEVINYTPRRIEEVLTPYVAVS